MLAFTSYCTGEGQTATCYQLTPGTDHEACSSADAEAVLATYELIPNPFFGPLAESPNQWSCQDQSGTQGLCQVSYSIPLNTLVFSTYGEGWIGGDDGVLYHLANQVWSEALSPTTHPIFDLSFSSPTDGWAVGAGAQVLRWGGKAWMEVLPYHGAGEGPGGSTQVLYGVDATSTQEAWMVGSMKGIDGITRPYALHWNGADLVEQNEFPECNCGLNAVLILGKDNVIAVGRSDLGAIALQWDGSAWSLTPIQGADNLYALAQFADGSVWAAGIEVARDRSDTAGRCLSGMGRSGNASPCRPSRVVCMPCLCRPPARSSWGEISPPWDPTLPGSRSPPASPAMAGSWISRSMLKEPSGR